MSKRIIVINVFDKHHIIIRRRTGSRKERIIRDASSSRRLKQNIFCYIAIGENHSEGEVMIEFSIIIPHNCLADRQVVGVVLVSKNWIGTV